MTRQEANREIIAKLSEIVEASPDLRFGQILWNVGILYWLTPGVLIKDPHSEEPIDTLKRMNNETDKV